MSQTEKEMKAEIEEMYREVPNHEQYHGADLKKLWQDCDPTDDPTHEAFSIKPHGIEHNKVTEEMRKAHRMQFGLDGAFDSDEYIFEIQSKKIAENKRGDGGHTDYYDLPKNAKVLGDLIRHKKMGHAEGEAFCAIYRLNDNGERLRNLKKARYYLDEEIKYEESKTNTR